MAECVRRRGRTGRGRKGRRGGKATGQEAGGANKISLVSRGPDVLVIGAGIIGCSIAFELAGRGRSVEIVDDRPPGMGATQAAAGMLAPYLEAHDAPLLELTTRSLA